MVMASCPFLVTCLIWSLVCASFFCFLWSFNALLELSAHNLISSKLNYQNEKVTNLVLGHNGNGIQELRASRTSMDAESSCVLSFCPVGSAPKSSTFTTR
jgi:hypothetical protein